jgi:hypothetical protein
LPVQPERGDQSADQNGRHDPAQEDDLAHRQRVAGELHERIVQDECKLRQDDSRNTLEGRRERAHRLARLLSAVGACTMLAGTATGAAASSGPAPFTLRSRYTV